jgi:hypothetical protein
MPLVYTTLLWWQRVDRLYLTTVYRAPCSGGEWVNRAALCFSLGDQSNEWTMLLLLRESCVLSLAAG